MASGIVKWFSPSVGYGYITCHDGQEIYFHFASIKDRDGGVNWSPGTKVEFDLIETRIGFEATNVRSYAL